MIFWLIWNKWNIVRQEANSIDFHSIHSQVRALLQEFTSAQNAFERPHTPTPRLARWNPPEGPFYKVNFDGAVFHEEGAASISVVICNSSGSVIGSLSQRISLPSSVATVEALACRRAIQFARELRIFYAIFEGDFRVVMKAL